MQEDKKNRDSSSFVELPWYKFPVRPQSHLLSDDLSLKDHQIDTTPLAIDQGSAGLSLSILFYKSTYLPTRLTDGAVPFFTPLTHLFVW